MNEKTKKIKKKINNKDLWNSFKNEITDNEDNVNERRGTNEDRDEKPEEKDRDEKPEEKDRDEKPEDKARIEKPEDKARDEKPEDKARIEKPEEKPSFLQGFLGN